MIILNELHGPTDNFLKNFVVKAFKEKTTIIAENLGLENDNLWNTKLSSFHLMRISEILIKLRVAFVWKVHIVNELSRNFFYFLQAAFAKAGQQPEVSAYLLTFRFGP